MAHEHCDVNGRVSLMYAGGAPWQGMGSRLAAPAPAAEAIAAAGFDYDISLADLTTSEGIPVPTRKAVVRTDTNDVLGVVGNSYVPVQNSQAFGFLDAIAVDGGIRYHTAGALLRCERIWLLDKLPGQIRVRGSDDLSKSVYQNPLLV